MAGLVHRGETASTAAGRAEGERGGGLAGPAEGSSPVKMNRTIFFNSPDIDVNVLLCFFLTFSIAQTDGYWFTSSLRQRRQVQQSGSRRTQQSAGVGCLVALRDEICLPAAVCVGSGRPNFIT